MSTKTAVSYIVHDDNYYLVPSIASFREGGDVFVFVSRIPWHEQPGDWQHTVQIAEEAGATVVLGDWASELGHSQATRDYLLDHGYTHTFIPDGDEGIGLQGESDPTQNCPRRPPRIHEGNSKHNTAESPCEHMVDKQRILPKRWVVEQLSGNERSFGMFS